LWYLVTFLNVVTFFGFSVLLLAHLQQLVLFLLLATVSFETSFVFVSNSLLLKQFLGFYQVALTAF
jgi:hypothetical protein